MKPEHMTLVSQDDANYWNYSRSACITPTSPRHAYASQPNQPPAPSGEAPETGGIQGKPRTPRILSSIPGATEPGNSMGVISANGLYFAVNNRQIHF